LFGFFVKKSTRKINTFLRHSIKEREENIQLIEKGRQLAPPAFLEKLVCNYTLSF